MVMVAMVVVMPVVAVMMVVTATVAHGRLRRIGHGGHGGLRGGVAGHQSAGGDQRNGEGGEFHVGFPLWVGSMSEWSECYSGISGWAMIFVEASPAAYAVKRLQLRQ